MNKISTKYFTRLFHWINTFEPERKVNQFPSEFEVVEKVFEHIKPEVKENSNILDLGCGCGNVLFTAKEILGKEHKYVGIDHNQTYLDVAKVVGHDFSLLNTDLLSLQTDKLISNADIIYVYIPLETQKEMDNLYYRIFKHSKDDVIVLCNDANKNTMAGFTSVHREEGSDCCSNKTDIRIFKKN